MRLSSSGKISDMAQADRTLIAILLVSLVVICGRPARADLGREEYRCPLLSPYAVCRADLSFPPDSSGLYQLVKMEDSGSAISSQFLVKILKKVAVRGQMIVGTTEKGYFIFDTSQQNAEPQTFTDVEHWQTALKASGIPANIQLNDPDVLAATMPDYQLHPLHYLRMKRLFGLSDDDWGNIVLLTSLAVIFVRGLLMRPNASLFPLAVLLAWLATAALIASGVIDVGGFLGFIIYPGLYWLVGKFGQFFKKFIWRRR